MGTNELYPHFVVVIDQYSKTTVGKKKKTFYFIERYLLSHGSRQQI